MDSTLEPATVSKSATQQPKCCENCQIETLKTCYLCKNNVCKRCRSVVNATRWICRDCKTQIIRELREERPSGRNKFFGLLGGVAAAFIASTIMTVTETITKLDLDYLFVGAGYLCGYAVFLSSSQKRSIGLQNIAFFTTFLVLFIAPAMPMLWAVLLMTPAGTNVDFSGLYAAGLLVGAINVVHSLWNVWHFIWTVAGLAVATAIVKPSRIHMQ